MHTTAIYPNRLDDKDRVESECGIVEFGNANRVFRTKGGQIFAVGYERVVYGDHGPYVEFRREQIRCTLQRKFDRDPPSGAYYEWLYPVGEPSVKVYLQRRAVKWLDNPPAGGFMGNRRDGYADYRVGMIYVSPFDLVKDGQKVTFWRRGEF